MLVAGDTQQLLSLYQKVYQVSKTRGEHPTTSTLILAQFVSSIIFFVVLLGIVVPGIQNLCGAHISNPQVHVTSFGIIPLMLLHGGVNEHLPI